MEFRKYAVTVYVELNFGKRSPLDLRSAALETIRNGMLCRDEGGPYHCRGHVCKDDIEIRPV